MMGWDRPLQQFYLLVRRTDDCDADGNNVVYASIADCGFDTSGDDAIADKLAELDIDVPQRTGQSARSPRHCIDVLRSNYPQTRKLPLHQRALATAIKAALQPKVDMKFALALIVSIAKVARASPSSGSRHHDQIPATPKSDPSAMPIDQRTALPDSQLGS